MDRAISKQRWIYREKYACVNPVATDEDTLPAALFGLSYGTHEQMYAAAAAPEMLDALKMVVDRSVLKRVQRNTVDSDIVTVKFNPDQWRIITDAITKATERGT